MSTQEVRLFDSYREQAVRHLGVKSAIKIPYRDGRVFNGEIVATMCGRFLRRFGGADDVSYYRTDGSRYSTPCKACGLEEQPK